MSDYLLLFCIGFGISIFGYFLDILITWFRHGGVHEWINSKAAKAVRSGTGEK